MADTKGQYAAGGGGFQQESGGGSSSKNDDATQADRFPELTWSWSAVDDFLRNPHASARLVADLDEWCDSRHLDLKQDESLVIDKGMYRTVGGRVQVLEHRPGARPRRRSNGEQWVIDFPATVTSLSRWQIRLVRDANIGPLLGLFQTSRYLRDQTRELVRDRVARHHHVWLCIEPGATGLEAPVAAHLLASSIAGQFGEAVLVVEILDEHRSRVTRHVRDRCEWYGELTDPPTEARVLEFIGELPASGDPAQVADPDRFTAKFHHFVYVNVQAPDRIDRVLPVAPFSGFDRIVHVGSKIDPQKARALERHLKEGARNRNEPGSPLFISFVPTFINGDRKKRNAGRAEAVRMLRPAGFDRMLANPKERPPGWRLLRDACWIDVDAEAISEKWSEWKRVRSQKSLISEIAEASSETSAAIEHWARAVTCRQVGLALSGGGASSYRFIPALKRFADERKGPDGVKRPVLPIDVLSGVSGGALIGAYYCAAGTAGCDAAISHGWQFQAALPSFALWSQTLEWLIDFHFGRRSIATLPTRFVPVAVCLMRGEPPETRIMLDRTIGEAVRASGSLPVVFGPSTLDGESYADGAFGSIIPVQAVTLYGADMVVAVNCIAGPSFGDALDNSDAFQLLRRLLPIGRFVDLWISIAYLQQEASRLVARSESAPFLIEPARSEGPFLEMAAFANAKGIAAKAREDKSFMQGVEHAITKWKMFSDLRADAKTRRNGGRAAETRAAAPRSPDDATS